MIKSHLPNIQSLSLSKIQKIKYLKYFKHVDPQNYVVVSIGLHLGVTFGSSRFGRFGENILLRTCLKNNWTAHLAHAKFAEKNIHAKFFLSLVVNKKK